MNPFPTTLVAPPPRRYAALAFAMAFALGACDDGGDSDATDTQVDAELDRGRIIDSDANALDAAVDAVIAADSAIDAEPSGPDAEMGGLCDAPANFGVVRTPRPVLEGPAAERASLSPQLIWSGSEWGLSWMSPAAEAGVFDVHFARFDRDWAPLSAPIHLGRARTARHGLAHDGTRYVSTWLAARTLESSFAGVAVQRIDASGTLDGEPARLDRTFDVQNLAIGWAPFGAGLIVFSRDSADARGVFAARVDESGAVANPVQIAEGPATGVSLAFGDGGWGVAWLDRDSEQPADLLFAIVGEDARLLGGPHRRESAGAQGGVSLAYGQGVFGLAWTALDGLGRLQANLSLIDSSGATLGTPQVTGSDVAGRAVSATWLEPSSFGVAWTAFEGATQRAGVSRVSTAGQLLGAVRVLPDESSNQLAMILGGTAGRVAAIFAHDPTPGPGGQLSAAVRLRRAELGACR